MMGNHPESSVAYNDKHILLFLTVLQSSWTWLQDVGWIQLFSACLHSRTLAEAAVTAWRILFSSPKEEV